MSERVSDRMLERAYLGELDDDQMRALWERLDRDGERYRLEALIEGHDEFLERYPAPMMAARIRERARQQERSAARRTPHGTGRAIGFAAVAGIVTVGIGLALSSIETKDQAPPVGGARLSVTEVPPVERARQEPEVQDVRDKPATDESERIDLGPKLGPGNQVILAPGETFGISARGVSRVAIDETKVLSVRVTSSAKTLQFTANEPGLTGIWLKSKADSPTFFARVAEPVPADALDEALPFLTAAFAACELPERSVPSAQQPGRPKVRILFSPNGSVLSAHPEAFGEFEAAQLDCPLQKIREWEIAAQDGMRTALLGIAPSAMRGAGATPPPPQWRAFVNPL